MGAVNQPNKRRSRGAVPCDQIPERRCPELSTPQEPVRKLQKPEDCGIAQSTTELESPEQQAGARIVAEKGANERPLNALADAKKGTPDDGNSDLPLAVSSSTNKKKEEGEVEHPEPLGRNFIDSHTPVLGERLKHQEEGRNTSQETVPGNDSRVTSSPISFMCLTSASGLEEDHRTVDSIPSVPGAQQKEKEIANKKDQQAETCCSSTGQTVGLGTEPNCEDHQTISPTLAFKGTQRDNDETHLANAANAIRKEHNADIRLSTDYIVDQEARPNTAFAESLGDRKEPKANSRKKKRKSCRNKTSQIHNEVEPRNIAGTGREPVAAADSAVADGDPLDHGLLSKEPAGESLSPQDPSKQTDDAKSVRKHRKKKMSKAKGKRRHGRTGRR